MPLQPGTRLRNYEIVAPLGAGGMGEVYRARDTKLNRDVALKVLPQSFSTDPDRLARFEREATTLAGLSHPGILAIHDFGVADGVAYAVTELLEGATLRDRLAGGRLPVGKVVDYATQIARALGAAHDKGVVHRDLKPENIFITSDGRAKILDFGLAKAPESIGVAETGLQSPTVAATDPGMVLGTVGYMSPEQVRGETATPLSDIFSFGCVLHEMLTGSRAFARDTPVETMTAILREEPASIEPGVASTSALGRVIARCLEKQPGERFQSARDLAFAIGNATSASSEVVAIPAEQPGARRPWLSWVAAATAFAAGILLATLTRPVEPPQRVVSNLNPPEGYLFNATEGPPQLSPDSREIAALATADGQTHLFVRALDELVWRRLEGTEGAMMPFWSPDGRWLGFFAGGALRKVQRSGGRPVELADAPRPGGGSWSNDGRIIFVGHEERPPLLVNADGGPVQQLPDPYSTVGTLFMWPLLLEQEDAYLVVIQDLGGPHSGLSFVPLGDSHESRTLTRTISRPTLLGPSMVALTEGDSLVARSLDLASGRLGDEAELLAEGVGWGQYYTYGRFSLSPSTLVYQAGPGAIGDAELVEVDRSGNELSIVGERAEYYNPRLSHDGARVAVDITDIQSTHGDIWVLEPARNTRTRLTDGPLDESDPVWSPDDGAVLFRRVPDVYLRDASGATADRVLLESGENKTPEDLSPDGRHLLFEILLDDQSDLWLLDQTTSQAQPWSTGTANDREPRFSPDGRWVAYQSDESGTEEVYVRSFPEGLERSIVSAGGGRHPVWSADGSELFYHSLDQQIVSVSVERSGDALRFGQPTALFHAAIRDSVFDVYPDAQRFLLNRLVPRAEEGPLVLIQNWQTASAGR